MINYYFPICKTKGQHLVFEQQASRHIVMCMNFYLSVYFVYNHRLAKTVIMCEDLSISLKPNYVVCIENFLML